MSFLTTILVFVVTFGVLITFHEYGHFWAARRMGIKVLRFSIGFGKPFYTWHDSQGTEFVITPFPLGGYVKMLDQRDCNLAEFAEQADCSMADIEAEEFTAKSVWARIFVVAAGPVANLLLAILVLWGVYLGGERGLAPVIEQVEAQSLAAEAGLEAGQEIVEVDGLETPTRQALQLQLFKRLGESGTLLLSVRYPDSDLVYQSEIELDHWLQGVAEPDVLGALGLQMYRPDIELILSTVEENSPGDRAGLRAGDELLRVDGQAIESWASLVSYIQARPKISIDLDYRRNDKETRTVVVPQSVENQQGENIGRVGIAPSMGKWPEHMIREYRYSPLQALHAGVDRTWELSVLTVNAVKKMLFGQMSPKNMAGPITIAQVANDSAAAGWLSWLNLLALLSISLGIMNLLPIPMLDGGHLLYFVVEIFKGSPVSERVQIVGQQLGLFVLIGVFVLVMVNDIARL
ncbi:MAG: RIP metalloprotease RseP [Pseudomonadota bacterium]